MGCDIKSNRISSKLIAGKIKTCLTLKIDSGNIISLKRNKGIISKSKTTVKKLFWI